MNTVTLFSDFDPSTVKPERVKKMDTGGKIVWLNHLGRSSAGGKPDKCPIILQTRVLRTPTGIRENKKFDDSNAPPKFSMELALDPSDVEHAKLQEFDERVLTLAEAAKSDWLNLKYYDRSNLENVYSPALRAPRDPDAWPTTLRVTVPRRDGKFECPTYDIRRQQIDLDDFLDMSRNAQVTVIVRCTGVWIAAGRFGTTWKAQQILVHSCKASLTGFAFVPTPELEAGAADETELPISKKAPPADRASPAAAPPPPPPPPGHHHRTAEEFDDDDYLEDSD